MTDRRTRKTKLAIFHAFRRLLEKKPYEDITVQDIIREADTGRSTFYSHFETKDELLHELCANLFAHVCEMDAALIEETERAPSATLTERLVHTLSHLADPALGTKYILRSEGRPVFLKYFKKYMREAFTDYIDCAAVPAPEEYIREQAAETLADTLQWWFSSKQPYTAKEIAGFYLALHPKGLFREKQ